MEADRFGWIGSTRRAAVTTWVRAELAAWWGDWSTLVPVVEHAVDPSVVNPNAWLTSGQAVAVGCSGASALAAALVGVEAGGAGALARYIGEEALSDLMRRLYAGSDAPLPETRQFHEMPRHLTDERFGALDFHMDVCGFGIATYLARSVVDRVVPPGRTDTVALVGRRAAVSDAVSRVAVTLDLGDMALSELGSLRPGDVLVTQAMLDTLPSLAIVGRGEASPIARARLGARDGNRAVMLSDI